MTTPAGLWNAPQQRLAAMLSVLVPFQDFVGAADAAAALERIYFEGYPEPDSAVTGEYTLAEITALRPCAIIESPERNGWKATRVAEEKFITSGELLITFVASVSGATHGLPSPDDVTVHKNAVGAIVGKSDEAGDDGLLDLAWQSPYLATAELSCIEGPGWGDPELAQDEGVWIASTWLLSW